MSTQSIGANGVTLGTVFAWDNNVSAAVAYPPSVVDKLPNGTKREVTAAPICMQRAMTAGATSTALNGKVSEKLLTLVGNPAAQGSEPLAEAALNVSRSVLALSASTERTAFLDTGMFYLCQLAANGAITKDQLKDAVTELISSAAGMTPTATQLASLAAPELRNGEEPNRGGSDGVKGTPDVKGEVKPEPPTSQKDPRGEQKTGAAGAAASGSDG